MSSPRPFDALSIPLTGTHLVEASAGTGKTFGLCLLILRLLLEKRLALREILVVTFTRAATAELRERVSLFLHQALEYGEILDCPQEGELPPEANPGVVSLLRSILEKGPDAWPSCRSHILRTLSELDDASIFTIHSFCQRTLQDHAFETGTRFDATLLPDSSELIRKITEDFWRRNVSEAGPALAYLLAEKAGSSDVLDKTAELLRMSLERPSLEIHGPDAFDYDFQEVWKKVNETWQEEDAITFLTSRKWRKKSSYTSTNLSRWANNISHCLPSNRPDPEVLANFAWSQILKKCETADPPEAPDPAYSHIYPVLHNLDTLWKIAKSPLNYLGYRLRKEGLAELERRKSEQGVLLYGDLLTRLECALRDEAPSAPLLRESLRTRYRAVLVDEFQDTDPVQYAIFRQAFCTEDHPVFFIGDPKQSIYAFRGADIFAYLEAKKATPPDHFWGMDTNYRSTPAFVDACNRLYDLPARRPEGSEDEHRPFLQEGIDYQPVQAGRQDTPPLLRNGEELPPVEIWDMESLLQDAGERSKQERTTILALCNEIASLLDGTVTRGGRPLRPGDLAVLVDTNLHATGVKQALTSHGIPARTGKSSSVFESEEAEDLRIFLEALADPGNIRRCRAALLTRLLGLTLAEVEFLARDMCLWETWLERFRTWREAWMKSGSGAALGRMLAETGARLRLLALPQGERCLVNTLHLLDLLQEYTLASGAGPEEAAVWFARQMAQGGEGDRETLQQRLETDREAVQILTVHVSKGLEFPVVFAPFSSRKCKPSTQSRKIPICHKDGRLLADLSGDLKEETTRETLAEHLRLFYVALTRAQCRAYLCWCPTKDDPTAGSHMLHDLGSWLSHHPEETRIALRQPDLSRQDARPSAAPVSLPDAALPVPRTFRARVDTSWNLHSYSSLLASHGTILPDARDRDSATLTVPDTPSRREGFFAFHRGGRAGDALHEILERADFAASASDLEPLAKEVLTRFGLEGSDPDGAPWSRTVATRLVEIFAAELPTAGTRFRLRDIGRKDRSSELEFHLSLSQGIPATRLLREANLSVDHVRDTELRGLLTGFVDLVARHDGRYYILDWKSNDLGPRFDDYAPDRLAQAMAAHRYDLQLHLYTVALHRHLKLRLGSSYDYDRHMGGALYLFLRGVSPDGATGVHVFRPSAETVQRLDSLLGV